MIDMEKLEREVPVTGSLRRAEEVSWINPRLERAKDALEKIRLTMKDVEEAGRQAPAVRAFYRKSVSRDRVHGRDHRVSAAGDPPHEGGAEPGPRGTAARGGCS